MDLGPQDMADVPAYVYEMNNDFVCEENLAQYGGSDYSNAVRVERGISLAKAFEIANSDANIDYFFYTKGGMMVLEVPADVIYDLEKDPLHLVTSTTYQTDNGEIRQGLVRIFEHGDVVFFKGEGKWLGSAPGLADVYVKEKK